MSAGNDVASDLGFGTTCLFQTSGLLLYFFKRIRSEVFHFQLPLTQIYYLLVALQTEFLLQRFSQNVFTCDYIVTHAYVWAACHMPQFISYLSKSCFPLVSETDYLLKRLPATLNYS